MHCWRAAIKRRFAWRQLFLGPWPCDDARERGTPVIGRWAGRPPIRRHLTMISRIFIGGESSVRRRGVGCGRVCWRGAGRRRLRQDGPAHLQGGARRRHDPRIVEGHDLRVQAGFPRAGALWRAHRQARHRYWRHRRDGDRVGGARRRGAATRWARWPAPMSAPRRKPRCSSAPAPTSWSAAPTVPSPCSPSRSRARLGLDFAVAISSLTLWAE